MGDKPIEFHPAAEEELESAADWYAERSDTAPIKFLSEVDRGVRLILQAPRRWPAGARGTRVFVLRRFPYVLVYRELLHSVQIVAVAHEKRRPNYWKGRV